MKPLSPLAAPFSNRSSRSERIVSSESNLPAWVHALTLAENSASCSIRSRTRSPVEMCGIPTNSATFLAYVPFPTPLGPTKTQFVLAGCPASSMPLAHSTNECVCLNIMDDTVARRKWLLVLPTHPPSAPKRHIAGCHALRRAAKWDAMSRKYPRESQAEILSKYHRSEIKPTFYIDNILARMFEEKTCRYFSANRKVFG
mmetsp:Transcript_20930/g.45900  ORF Transcript_20930/g.45900 Transcript_20930/m.45900 type:complete len:200 (-) Transcript_20930:15-614(-)